MNDGALGKKIQFQLEKFHLPERYGKPLICWDALKYLTQEDRDFARQFVDSWPDNSGWAKNNTGESIWLSSSRSGTGKTAVAVCIVLDLIRTGKLDSIPLFVSFRYLMETMKQNRDDCYLDNMLMTKILGSSVTIFDDIGLERPTDSVTDRYILLFEQLWLRRKRAIFTSKITLGEFVNTEEDWRRLRQTGDQPSRQEMIKINIMESIGSRLSGTCIEYEIKNRIDYRFPDGQQVD
jgi:hypothetical protein